MFKNCLCLLAIELAQGLHSDTKTLLKNFSTKGMSSKISRTSALCLNRAYGSPGEAARWIA